MSAKFNNAVWLLVGSSFVITLVACKRDSIPPPQVPDNLRVPDGQTVLVKGLGKGVQIYECTAKAGDPGTFEWIL